MSDILFILTPDRIAAEAVAHAALSAAPAPSPAAAEVGRTARAALRIAGAGPRGPAQLPTGGLRAGLVEALAALLGPSLGDGPRIVTEEAVAPLLPLWAEACVRIGARPRVLLLVPEAPDGGPGPARGFRLLLEAEGHSRDLPRAILTTGAALRDPAAAMTAAQAAPAARDAGAGPAGLPVLAEGAVGSDDPARATHAALCQLMADPEDAAALDRLDALRQRLEAQGRTEQPRPRRAPPADTQPLDLLLARSAAEAGMLRARLDAAHAAFIAQRREILELYDRLRIMSGTLWSVQGALVAAHRHPIRLWRQRLERALLHRLSRWHPPLSARATARFGRLAAKRELARPENLARLAPAMAAALPVPVRPARLCGCQPEAAERPGVLIVVPDARRTEEAAVALGLMRALGRANRVDLLLLAPGGPLLEAFRAAATAVWQPDRATDPGHFGAAAIAEICAQTAPRFAVVNSVAARHALGPLRRAGVATVALVHELAAFCTPPTAVSEAVAQADAVVFPAHMVREDALATDYMLSPSPRMHVLPPGRCDLPPAQPGADRDAEVPRLRALLRPEGLRRLVVLGTGPVSYRCGVDLFVETARRVLSRPEGRDALFVWSGPGFDPGRDGFSSHLRRQLRHEGLEKRVILLPEADAPGALHALADLFVLPARADPLSLGGIAALQAGLPALCFEGAAGVAEALSAAGMEADCVAGYLDVAGLADRIVALMAAPDRRAAVAARSALAGARWFDADAWADALAALAVRGDAPVACDVRTIAQSPGFDPAFCLGRADLDREDAARRYLAAMRCGLAVRKPEPGFHPLVFAQARPVPEAGGDPYAEFLRLGRPEGPWLCRVIEGGPAAASAPARSLRTALHVHAYFLDQLADIAARLRRNAAGPDLFVSVADAAGAAAAAEILQRQGATVAAIEVVPNVGRDIGPLLSGFGPRLVAGYDLVGHVHTKKTGHAADAEMVRRWVDLTLSGVLGGRQAGPMMDRIIAAFAGDDRLGVAYPDDPHVFGWTANRAAAQALLAAMARGPAPAAFNFPVGTMFWMRAAALRPFVDLGLRWADYPAEPLANDGTMLHALERLFGVVPVLDGWSTAVTVTRGLDR